VVHAHWQARISAPAFLDAVAIVTSPPPSIDETARLRAEIAHLRAQLDEANAIVQSAFDAYIGIDRHGRVIAWNRQAERTFGWTRDEMLGHDMAERIIPLHLRPSHARGLARFLATGEGPVLNRRIEVSALHRDGRIFPVELSIWPVGSGPSLRFNAFLHDVSERAAAVQRLEVQNAVSIALVGASGLREVAPDLLAALGQALEWDVAVLWLPDDDGALRCAAFWSRPKHTFPAYAAETAAITFAVGEGLPGRVLAARAPLWFDDITREGNCHRAASARKDGLHAALGFPILGGDQCRGVVECVSVRTLPADELLLGTTRVLGHLLGQFIERERMEQALARRAAP
jgi:PAS domain S-box-containing protein